METPGVEITVVEIPGVNNPAEETDTNVTPGNPPVTTLTSDKNTTKVDTPKPVPTQHDPNNVVTINDRDKTDKEDKNYK